MLIRAGRSYKLGNRASLVLMEARQLCKRGNYTSWVIARAGRSRELGDRASGVIVRAG